MTGFEWLFVLIMAWCCLGIYLIIMNPGVVDFIDEEIQADAQDDFEFALRKIISTSILMVCLPAYTIYFIFSPIPEGDDDETPQGS